MEIKLSDIKKVSAKGIHESGGVFVSELEFVLDSGEKLRINWSADTEEAASICLT